MYIQANLHIDCIIGHFKMGIYEQYCMEYFRFSSLTFALTAQKVCQKQTQRIITSWTCIFDLWIFMSYSWILMRQWGKSWKTNTYTLFELCLQNQCRLCYKLKQRNCMLHSYVTSSVSIYSEHFCRLMCGVNNQYNH